MPRAVQQHWRVSPVLPAALWLGVCWLSVVGCCAALRCVRGLEDALPYGWGRLLRQPLELHAAATCFVGLIDLCVLMTQAPSAGTVGCIMCRSPPGGTVCVLADGPSVTATATSSVAAACEEG